MSRTDGRVRRLTEGTEGMGWTRRLGVPCVDPLLIVALPEEEEQDVEEYTCEDEGLGFQN